jgi:hypothetical protein
MEVEVELGHLLDDVGREIYAEAPAESPQYRAGTITSMPRKLKAGSLPLG